MDIAKLTLEYLKALASWPIVVFILVLFFNKQIRALIVALLALIDRIKKIEAFGLSIAAEERLIKEATPALPAPQTDIGQENSIELSVSSGAYSMDYRAIFLVAGLANRTERPDQVVAWKLSFPSLNIELEPTAAPHNLVGRLPWWSSPLVKLPPNEFVQGTLYFRGVGVLAEGLIQEPLPAKLTATTLYGKLLSHNAVQIYKMTTLQASVVSNK
jgi:hypothetical protein